jgi:hypothetical protein
MDPTFDINPFVSADAYRTGQKDGFKAGLAAGVVVVLLVKAALKKTDRRPLFRTQKTTK